MIWQLLQGFIHGDAADVDMAGLLMTLAATAVVLILCLPMHEFAHAWMAKKMGDNTAWMHGRLTLNPSKHLDLVGTLMILFIGFGYAKPVPVNPRNFNNGKYKQGMALTAAAGPVSNLILAVIFCLLTYACYAVNRSLRSDALELVWQMLGIVSFRNIGLAVFNLIPFPPLDGSRILDLILPGKVSRFIDEHENIFRYGIYLLLFFGSPIGKFSVLLFNGLSYIIGLPFNAHLTFFG